MKRVIFSIIVLAALAGGSFVFYSPFSRLSKKMSVRRNAFVSDVADKSVTNAKEEPPERIASNSFTGLSCHEGDRRPFAVMLAGDKAARPLSGIADADAVVEMPVLTNGITRYMAIFACGRPEIIGSIRSARHDFLPFAKSFDAIFAHWGGSYLALDILKTGALDNIDSLPNPFDAFYRQEGKRAPHNGFTSFMRLLNAAQKLNYRIFPNKTKGYAHIEDAAAISADQNISLRYPQPYEVDFAYDYKVNVYRRWRGGAKEIDAATGAQVEVKNIIVMVARSQQVNPDYNEVAIEGEGDLAVYRNGEVIKGKWKRAKESYGVADDAGDSKYYFLDSSGREIGLVKGKIWISVVQPNQKVELTLK